MKFTMDELRDRAHRVMPGLHSNFRRTGASVPLVLTRAEGFRCFDTDGKDYIDLVLGMGPAIWGHSHARYVRAIHAQLDTLFSAPSSLAHTEQEIDLAEKVVSLLPCAEAVRFGISGSEAVQLVLRLARAFTGRPGFVRFEGHYHGWLDNVFGGEVDPDDSRAPHPMLRKGAPGISEGLSALAAQESFMLPWNDADALEALFAGPYGQEVGLVLMEAIMCNTGCCPPRPGYLERVRELCDRHGALLCFDEVITGFRVGLSGAQGLLGVTPDLAVLGKALAGGLPLAAVAGRRKVLDLLHSGQVLGGGTFNSFPLATAAAINNLRMLEADDGGWYRATDLVQARLMTSLRDSSKRHGHALLLQGPRGIFYYDFIDAAHAWTPRDLRGAIPGKAERFRMLAREEGVLLGGGNRMVVSGAMDDQALGDTVVRLDRALARLEV